MTVNWVLMVLRKKGCSKQFVRVLQSIYKDSDTFVSCIINNEVQERILNKKKNIKQGCRRCYEKRPSSSSPEKILVFPRGHLRLNQGGLLRYKVPHLFPVN